MKIAIVVRSLKFGGMERAACNQADAFYQSGHDVDLIYFSEKNKAIKPKEENVNLKFIDINKTMKKNLFGFIWNIFSKVMNMILRGTYPLFKGIYTSEVFKKELKQLECEKKYDLILVRGQGTFEQIWKLKEDRIVKICVNVSTRKKSSLKDKLISKAYYENANVNCIANGTKKYYEDKFKREKIKPKTLISIKNPFFQENTIKLSNIIDNNIPTQPYILGLGRLVKAKNFELLIRSFSTFKKNFKSAHNLIIVGEGSERNNLEKLVEELNIKEYVYFVGYQKNPYAWMKNSELIVLTSKFEGLCNVLIESMCCQTRILINKCPGGMEELMVGKLKDNIAEANDISIANKMIKVLNNEKEYYFEDYKNLLDSLNPNNIVNEWVKSYLK